MRSQAFACCVAAIGVIQAEAGACSADDLGKIGKLPKDSSDQSFAGKSSSCGHEAYHILSGKFDHGKFNACMAKEVGISEACSECYAVAGDYGAHNCKGACLTGWCKEHCLQCTASAQQTASICSGYQNPPVKPCGSDIAEFAEANGACTADDLAKISKLPADTSDDSFGGKSSKCGHEAYHILSGKFDHDKFNACIASEVGISKSCSECYATAGEYGAHNCKGACLAGWCKEGCLQCTASAQQTAATCSGRPNPPVKPCSSLEESPPNGACSADDIGKINKLPQGTSDGSFGAKSSKCGHEAFHFLSGKFDHDKFDACMSTEVGISKGCSECYATAGEYGAHNCKEACFAGWCKAGCLKCTAAAQQTAAACSGRPNPPVAPCGTVEESAPNGACSGDDISKINKLPQDTSDASFGAKNSECGHKAYHIITGKFDHDKFNACLSSKVGISKPCAECYAAAGDYGAQHCKGACLAGWCKKGCLQCTSAAQQTAAACSGRPNPPVSPCGSSKEEVQFVV